MIEYEIILKFKRDILGGSEYEIIKITPKMKTKDADVLYDNVGLECPKEFEEGS